MTVSTNVPATKHQRELTPFNKEASTANKNLNQDSTSPPKKTVTYYAQKKACLVQPVPQEILGEFDDPAIMFSTPIQPVSSAPISPLFKDAAFCTDE